MTNNDKVLYVGNESRWGTKVTKGENIVSYERHGNDIYGNPLYKVYPVSFSMRKLPNVYKNYIASGYYLIQSYNILVDLYDLLEEIDKTIKVPSNWNTSQEYYEGLGYHAKHLKF